MRPEGISPDRVTAIIVTRGDVSLKEIRESLVVKDVIVWDNSDERVYDLGAFGRYGAIEAYLTAPVILVQDDDCLISREDQYRLLRAYQPGVLTALMPPSRNDYTDTVLVGWGAIFDRHLPFSAFRRWRDAGHSLGTEEFRVVGADFVFPMLTPWKRLDAEHEDLPWAHADNRTWASYPNYARVKEWYLREARALRDKEAAA